jgi:hypothetical protein
MDIASKPGGFNSLGGDKPKPVLLGFLFRPFGSGDGLLLPVCDEEETGIAGGTDIPVPDGREWQGNDGQGFNLPPSWSIGSGHVKQRGEEEEP